MANLKDTLMLGGDSYELSSFRPRGCHWFFDQDIDALPQTILSNRMVQVGWHGNANAINLSEEGVVICKGLGVTFLRDSGGAMLVNVGDADQSDIRQRCIFLRVEPTKVPHAN